MSNSSTWPIDKTLSGTSTSRSSEPGSDGSKGVLCITIRWFNVISRTFVEESNPLCRNAVGVFCNPNRLGFWDTNGSHYSGSKTRPSVQQYEKKRPCNWWMLPFWQTTKWKENEKTNTWTLLERKKRTGEHKRLWWH